MLAFNNFWVFFSYSLRLSKENIIIRFLDAYRRWSVLYLRECVLPSHFVDESCPQALGRAEGSRRIVSSEANGVRESFRRHEELITPCKKKNKINSQRRYAIYRRTKLLLSVRQQRFVRCKINWYILPALSMHSNDRNVESEAKIISNRSSRNIVIIWKSSSSCYWLWLMKCSIIQLPPSCYGRFIVGSSSSRYSHYAIVIFPSCRLYFWCSRIEQRFDVLP